MPRSYIIDDPVKKQFLLDRETLVSPAVLADEMAKIFSKCWIYVGHSSELKQPNDFVTRLTNRAIELSITANFKNRKQQQDQSKPT